MKKRILCYGDSNTWGYMPEGQPDGFDLRYPEDVRWTGVLQKMLGSGYVVVEEGLNGRTTTWDDPGFSCRNGLKFLECSLLSHAPLHLVVIMLGTNDLKPHICGRAEEIAGGVERLANLVLSGAEGPEGAAPKVLLVSPALVEEEIASAPFREDFDGHATCLESRRLADCYRAKAQACGCAFLDAAAFAKTGADGLHLTADSHAKLGAALADAIRELV